MISRYIFSSFLIFAQIGLAGANQAVESISALTSEKDVSELIEQAGNATDVVEPVIHDSGASAQNGDPLTSNLNDTESDSDKDALSSRNNLPPVGYVPKTARRDGHFDLVSQTANESDQLFQKSAASEKKKLYESALKTVQRVLLTQPDHPNALLARGRLLVKTQQYSAAISNLQSLTELRTDDWRPWFWLGTANLMIGDLAAAELALDEALARNSDVAENWLHRALVAQQRGNWQSALQLLSIANEITPDHPLVMLNAAMCREALGYQDEAMNGYRKFLAQSHRTDVSKLLRFEVINHLSTDRVAAQLPELQQEVEAVSVQEFGETPGIVANDVEDTRVKHRFP